MSSSAETSFDYEGVVWTCVLLPYRILVCRDAIQYIVQVRLADTLFNDNALVHRGGSLSMAKLFI